MPKTPISAKTYIANGLPWYQLYDDELLGVKYNNKSLVASVKSIGKFKDKFSDVEDCSICEENKVNTEFQLCKHSMCSECTTKLLEQFLDKKCDFPCPLCRMSVKNADVIIKSAILNVE
jgi:hypothetical protein